MLTLETIFAQLAGTLNKSQKIQLDRLKDEIKKFTLTLTKEQALMLDGKVYKERVDRFLSIPNLQAKQIFIIDRETLYNLMIAIEAVVKVPVAPGFIDDSLGVKFKSKNYPNALTALRDAGLFLTNLTEYGVPALGISCSDKNDREHGLVRIVDPKQLIDEEVLSNLVFKLNN